MKQAKVNDYQPKYPKKLIKGAALTAAAMLAMSGAACKPMLSGVPMLPVETPEPEPEGIVPVDTPDETPDPNLTEPGEPMVDEGEDAESHTRDGDLMLEGKIVVDEPENP